MNSFLEENELLAPDVTQEATLPLESSAASAEQPLSPEDVAKYEELALKGAHFLLVQIREWLAEDFAQASVEHITARVREMNPVNIKAKVFDLYTDIPLVSRMIKIGSLTPSQQKDVLRAWESSEVAQFELDASFPEELQVGDLKQEIVSTLDSLISTSDMEPLSNSFVANYKKEDGVLVRKKPLLDKLREIFESLSSTLKTVPGNNPDFDARSPQAMQSAGLEEAVSSEEEIAEAVLKLSKIMNQYQVGK